MAKAKPSSSTNIAYTVWGIVGLVAWFGKDYIVDFGPDIFYGQYGGILLGGITAVIAYIKGRNPVAWFAIGTWFVIVGLIIILVLSKLYDALCPLCREGISREAKVCPHCRRDIDKLAEAKVSDC